ncbi:hypothetical protein YC2023_090413 [Brassica napus]
MMVEPIDFVFSKDAFKSTQSYVRDFIGPIQREILGSNGEESNWVTRALEVWESCGFFMIYAFTSILRINGSLVLSL